MTDLVFLDTETTGLNPDCCELWEIAAIVRRKGWADDVEYCWQLRPNLGTAEPTGLRISRYYERSLLVGNSTLANALAVVDPDLPDGDPLDVQRQLSPAALAARLALLLDGAHIVGAVPSFDEQFLRRFLYEHGQVLTAHYHLIDVETLAVGYLAAHGTSVPLPWRSDELSRMVGVDPAGDADRHTALGDARWARAIFDAVTLDNGVDNAAVLAAEAERGVTDE